MSTESNPVNKEHNSKNGSREKRDRSFGGIKFFRGSPLPEFEERKARYETLSPEQLRDTHKVWRPEETLEAAYPFFNQNRVNVVGSPQSGKGTILFGLSEICDSFGWGYVFIDGHHQETPASVVVGALEEAQRRKVPVFFDSFDYLFLGSRRYRIISIIKQEERTSKIVDAIDKTTVPIAITHHDEEWAKLFLNPELRNKFKSQIDRFPIYQIPDSFKSSQSIRRFLIDQNVPLQEAEFLAGFSCNTPMSDRFRALIGDEQTLQSLFKATASFPVLKEIARDSQREIFLPLLREITHEGNKVNDFSLLRFANIILEADKKRANLASIRRQKGKRL